MENRENFEGTVIMGQAKAGRNSKKLEEKRKKKEEKTFMSPLKMQHNTTKTFHLIYILVQQSGHVSLSGLPVLRTLYKPIPMHKSTKS